MATAQSYIEGQAIPREDGLIENLMDFSFQRLVTPRLLKMLYSVHLLIGLVAAVWFVFTGFQNVYVQWPAGAHSRRSGDASVDCVLPHRRGTPGRRIPSRPGHHEFAGISETRDSWIVIRPSLQSHPFVGACQGFGFRSAGFSLWVFVGTRQNPTA